MCFDSKSPILNNLKLCLIRFANGLAAYLFTELVNNDWLVYFSNLFLSDSTNRLDSADLIAHSPHFCSKSLDQLNAQFSF